MSGLQKSGYLNVKQPSTVKGRKLKSWKLRWVVLHKMSNIAEGTFAAKIDLYHNEDACKKLSQDRTTFILENITALQASGSKTHKNAFDIVQTYPVFSLSALSETDTLNWVKTFQQLFWPAPDPDGKDVFQIIIEENEDSKRFGLTGEYWLLLSPESLAVKAMSKAHSMEWKLCNLKRFNLDKHDSKILIIESGAKSDIGEARFTFRSNNVPKIFHSIRKNIMVAVEKRQRKISSSEEGRERTSSATNSENEFKVLLENSNDESVAGGSSRNNSPQLKCKSLGTPSPQLKCKSHTTSSPRLPSKNRTLVSDNNQVSINTVEKTTEHNEGSVVSLGVLSPILREFELRNQTVSASYDELNFSPTLNKNQDTPQIISSEVILDKSSEREINIEHDSKGYSHITKRLSSNTSQTDQIPKMEDNFEKTDTSTSNKARSASDQSSQSFDTQRSESVSSYDSGCIVSQSERERRKSDTTVQTLNAKKSLHRSCNSFDSAISTTSVSETITVSVDEAVIVSTKASPSHGKVQGTPQTKEDSKVNSQNNIYADINQGTKTPYEEVKESEYEDLEKYRKDLSKFLGMDPKINPSDVPPSLPDRPTTLPIRRKDLEKISKQKTRKKKTVTFNKNKAKNNEKSPSNSFSSSTSSTEEDDTENVTKVKNWPLNNSVTLQKNTLYEPSEINSQAQASDTISNNVEFTKTKHSSDSALMDMPNHHYSTADGNGYETVTIKKKESPVIDLLTGDPVETNETKTDVVLFPHSNDDSRSCKTTSIPPPVEQLIPLDIPANRNSELVFNSPSSEGENEQIIFRAKDDGNFVWDPFPSLGKFEAPIIDFENQTTLQSSNSENQIINLDDDKGASQTGGSDSPEQQQLGLTTFIDNLDPFDIFHLGFSTQNQNKSTTGQINETMQDLSEENIKALSKVQNMDILVDLDDNTYMDMSRRILPSDSEYVCPGDI